MTRPSPNREVAEGWEELADHMGPAYLRYSFTKGTEREVDLLVEHLGLRRGDRVLDVGCGPGRHALELARRGISVHGVDLSEQFVALAAESASGARDDRADCTFEVLDARRLADRTDLHGRFDAAISLCQGAFGSLGPPADPVLDPQNLAGDLAVLEGMAAAVRPGGRCAVTAFNAYFQVRWLEGTDRFDAATGLNVEDTEVADPHGRTIPARLWTTCSTPRELRLQVEAAGWVVDRVAALTDAGLSVPSLDAPQHLVLAHRPA